MLQQTIQIFARVKPTQENTSVYSVGKEEAASESVKFVVPKDLSEGHVNNKQESYKFRFQRVFDQDAGQEEIFETIAKPVADRVLAGYNGTIFAYGQTGSGKTHTMTGITGNFGDRGIIPRTLAYLYQHFSQDSSMVYTIHVSYLEIYNEVGYDLLGDQCDATDRKDLPKVTIMGDPEHDVQLRNLSIEPSDTEEQALDLLFLGDTKRMIVEASTRSHCIYTVYLCGRELGAVTVRHSKLHLVDLAGSERAAKSALAGQLLTEAKYINLSLHYLEQVILALTKKTRPHIPYRNSMMTMVLKDSLGGNCMTTMIANISVEKSNLSESISTCHFAQRVAVINNEAVVNEKLDPALLIVRLQKENQSLREELVLLRGQQTEDNHLAQDDVRQLEKQVRAFLDDPDPEATLALDPDLQKIHHSFHIMKAIFTQERRRGKGGSGRGHELSPPPAVRAAPEKISMRQKTGARDTTAFRSAGLQQMEAFDVFITNHKDHLTIKNNEAILERRVAEAKELGVHISKNWDAIRDWRIQLQMLRKQSAAQDHPEEEEEEPVKANVLNQLVEAEKDLKRGTDRLKELKAEIEHLRQLLKGAKVQLQQDFQEWWSRGPPAASSLSSSSSSPLQDSETPSRAGHPGLHSKPSTPGEPDSGSQTAGTPPGRRPSSGPWREDGQQTTATPTPELRDLSSTTLSSSSIPMTGIPQIDNETMAFIRARQSLLQRGALKESTERGGRSREHTRTQEAKDVP